MKNYIENTALIEALMNGWKPDMSFNDLLELINTVPKCDNITQNDPRWIPVSEKLPDETCEGLIWDWTDGDHKGCSVLVTIDNWANTKHSNPQVRETIFYKDVEDFNEDDVVAWMPIPKSYVPNGETIVYKAPDRFQELVKKVKKYFDTINLNDYDLGGCEFVEDDYVSIAHLVERQGANVEETTNSYLYSIRQMLDEGLED